MDNDRKDCEGCYIKEISKTGNCAFTPINKDGVYCPCQTCLVKTMCKTGCEEFGDVHKIEDGG